MVSSDLREADEAFQYDSYVLAHSVSVCSIYPGRTATVVYDGARLHTPVNLLNLS